MNGTETCCELDRTTGPFFRTWLQNIKFETLVPSPCTAGNRCYSSSSSRDFRHESFDSTRTTAGAFLQQSAKMLLLYRVS